MEEVIATRRQLKLNGNQEAYLITEKAILKVQETNKIRERYRVVCEFPAKPSDAELRKKREIEIECEFSEERK